MLDVKNKHAMAEIGRSLYEDKEISELAARLAIAKTFEVIGELEAEHKEKLIQGLFTDLYMDLCRTLAENAALKDELETLKSAGL